MAKLKNGHETLFENDDFEIYKLGECVFRFDKKTLMLTKFNKELFKQITIYNNFADSNNKIKWEHFVNDEELKSIILKMKIHVETMLNMIKEMSKYIDGGFNNETKV